MDEQRAIEKLERLIQKGSEVLRTHKPPSPGIIGFPTLDSGAFNAWQTQSLSFLESNLPPNSAYVSTFRKKVTQGYQSVVKTGIGILESVKEDFEMGDIGPDASSLTDAPASRPLCNSREVFLVHGRDEAAKQAVARFIEKLDLTPVILHEQPSEGRTIIEKFEKYSNVGFAIVLITPDDVGALAEEKRNLKPRARQNVILELGFFLGKLGRHRVCALYKQDVEIPSDYKGVLFIPMDAGNGWQLSLAKEIKAAGIKLDLNKVI